MSEFNLRYGIRFGEFMVYLSKDKLAVWIDHGGGEGGEFNLEVVSKALAKPLKKFYNENL